MPAPLLAFIITVAGLFFIGGLLLSTVVVITTFGTTGAVIWFFVLCIIAGILAAVDCYLKERW